MDSELIKLLKETKNSMIADFSKNIDAFDQVICGVEITFDKILRIVGSYDDVMQGKWIKFSDAYPEDFNQDWVLVQFVEKSGFVGLPYIAEFDKNKKLWRLHSQDSDDTPEMHYINNDCVPSSWKIIEKSPEWKESENRCQIADFL